jgi:hypothetical protein
MLIYLKNILSEVEEIYSEIGSRIQKPVQIMQKNKAKYRYKYHSVELICYLKGLKVISNLNAILNLHENGYFYEVGILCRSVFDSVNEIYFILGPNDGDKYSTEQMNFARDFFQEEFEDYDKPLSSNKKRRNVAVKKIYAEISANNKNILNQSDFQEILRVKHRAFSGYVHGAYPHIMEMYNDKFGRFHLSGMLVPERIEEWNEQIKSEIYCSVIALIFVSNKLKFKDIAGKIERILYKFEAELKMRSTDDAQSIVKKSK